MLGEEGEMLESSLERMKKQDRYRGSWPEGNFRVGGLRRV